MLLNRILHQLEARMERGILREMEREHIRSIRAIESEILKTRRRLGLQVGDVCLQVLTGDREAA